MTSKGHIYKIICKVDEKFCYIGSTFNRLSKRFEIHRNNYNQWKNGTLKSKCSCCEYFDKYGIENFKIVLIKSYEVCRAHVKDRKHLEAYETLWVSKTNCVNKNLPIQYLKKQKDKEYNEKNRETINKKNRECYEINKEKRKEYREKNRDKITQQRKEHYEINKDKINEKIQCECGATVSRHCLSRHKKTKKHEKLLAIINEL